MIHDLKTWPPYYQRVVDGLKTFEIRKNDRDFQVGDAVRLSEFNPAASTTGYTGRQWQGHITYLLHGTEFGIAEGYVVFGIVSTNNHIPEGSDQ